MTLTQIEFNSRIERLQISKSNGSITQKEYEMRVLKNQIKFPNA